MSIDMSMFLQTFYEESFEGLEIMESGLLDLDIGAADDELINSIFRGAHSIKGGSATFGLADIAAFTHLMETLLDELREGSRDVSQELVDTLLGAVDTLREMLTATQNSVPINDDAVEHHKELLQQALDSKGGTASKEVQPKSASSNAESPEQDSSSGGWHILFKPFHHLYKTGNDPVRIFRELADMGELKVTSDCSNLPTLEELDPEESYIYWSMDLFGDINRDALDEVFSWLDGDCDLEITSLSVESGEETVEKSPEDSHAKKNRPQPSTESEQLPIESSIEVLKGEVVDRRDKDRRAKTKTTVAETSSIRVSIDKVDAVINLVGELVITQSMLSTLGDDFSMDQIQRLRDGLTQLEQNTRELQEDVMRMRMLPISFVFNRFPRMIRDLSMKLSKDVELVMLGENTELDKTLIEKITDPLVHLVRNSVDHGIETPDVRVKKGKPARGRVTLEAAHKGGNIVIEVRDDGKGMDSEKLLKKAIEKGILNEGVSLSDEEIYNLIFEPGFSTAEEVSDVSGRGVGMDVVRRNILSLGGSISIASEPDKGSSLMVRLPLTLAILDGQTISAGDENYIIPLVSIVESIQIKDHMVRSVIGQGETFNLRGNYLPIIRLGDL